MLPTFSLNVTLQEAFENVAEINEELRGTEFDCAFCTTFKLLVDKFSSFFAKRIKSVEKMINQRKNRSNRTSKIVKSRKSYSNGDLLYHCSFY